jgi:hypothetical protein
VARKKEGLNAVDLYSDRVYALAGDKAAQRTPVRLTLAFGADAAIAAPDQTTVVRGLFHKGSITLFYGLPKSGKSFLVTSAALAVADPDIDYWMGQRILQHGPVLYVACEGHGGFWKRLQAARNVPNHFALATGRPMLIRNDDGRGYAWVPNPDDIQHAITETEQHYGQAPVLVIIDTVFRSFGGGNVNDSSHMNAYVGAAQAIADGRCAVALVHHTSKSGTSPAGSVSLMGAADTLVMVQKMEDKSHTWAIEEAKDDAASEPFPFRLEVVKDIIDASGEPVSSCVLVPLAPDETPMPKNGVGRKSNARRIDKVLEILARILNENSLQPVAVALWRDAVFRETAPDDPPETKRKSFRRDRDVLIAQGHVVATDGWVSIP